jgi:hypothetical protein
MASFTLTDTQSFPVGTSIGAYLVSNWLTRDLPPSGAPAGSATASATMGIASATFTGLTEGQSYYVAGQVGGVWRYVAITLAIPAGGSGGGLPAGGTLGQTLVKLSSTDGDAAWQALTRRLPEFLIDDYGADPTGATDSSVAALAAWNAAIAAGGGIVRGGAGTYKLQGSGNTLFVPANGVPLKLCGLGRGVTTFRLSTQIPTLVKNAATYSVGDFFGKVAIEDLTVDANNVSAANHGALIDFFANFVNIDLVYVRRCDVVNAGAVSTGTRCASVDIGRRDPFGVFATSTLSGALGSTGVTVIPLNDAAVATDLTTPGLTFTLDTAGDAEVLTVVSVSGSNVTVAAPGTTKTHADLAPVVPIAPAVNTMTNVEFDECDFGIGAGGASTGGGASGIFIAAFLAHSQSAIDNAYFGKTVTAAPVFIDRVTLRRCRWRTTADPATFGVSAGMQIGGDALSGTIKLESCYVRGAWDDGFEIGAVLDLTMDSCVAENCWNENFFFANNHGGFPNPSQGVIRCLNSTSIISVSNTLTAGFMAGSLHGTSFGQIIFENCVHKHTAPRFLNGAGTSEANPSNGGFFLVGQWRHATLRDCSVVYDNHAGVMTANSISQQPPGLIVSQYGGTATLEVENLKVIVNGSGDNGAFTGGSMDIDAIKINNAARLFLKIDGVYTRSDFNRLNGYLFRMREVDLNMSGNAMTETWAGSTSLTSQHLVDAGAVADLSQGSTQLASVANHTTRKMFRIWNFNNTATSAPRNQCGRQMDASIYTEAVVSTSTPSGLELIARLRVADDGLSEIRAVVSDDGAASTIRVEKVTAGTPTTIAGPTTLTRITAGQTIGCRLKNQGNVVTADYFSSPGSAPAFTTAGTTTLSYTLAAGAETQTWGTDGMPGFVGWGWTPADATALHKRLKLDRLHVVSGTVDRLMPLGNRQGASGTNGLLIASANTGLRFEGTLQCRGWQRGAVKKDGTPLDVSAVDATIKGQVCVSQSNWAAPPASGAISLPASGVAYTNADMCPQDVTIFGGTLTTPFIQVTRAGVATQMGDNTSRPTIRLNPGDSFTPTYAVSTGLTMNKVQALA